jgi:hypothetical protein
MPETVEKREDRSVEELLGRLKKSIRQAADGETTTAEELS